MKPAFTMIELIFVIAIIGALAATAVPKLAHVREEAHISKSLNTFTTFLTDAVTNYQINGGVFKDMQGGEITSDDPAQISHLLHQGGEINVGQHKCGAFKLVQNAAGKYDGLQFKASSPLDIQCEKLFQKHAIAVLCDLPIASNSVAKFDLNGGRAKVSLGGVDRFSAGVAHGSEAVVLPASAMDH